MMMEAISLQGTTSSRYTTANKTTNGVLRESVRQAMDSYFQQLDGHTAANVYQMVLAEVEQPLLETVMEHTEGNQTRAAEVLGISRSTLRKKLALYNLD